MLGEGEGHGERVARRVGHRRDEGDGVVREAARRVEANGAEGVPDVREVVGGVPDLVVLASGGAGRVVAGPSGHVRRLEVQVRALLDVRVAARVAAQRRPPGRRTAGVGHERDDGAEVQVGRALDERAAVAGGVEVGAAEEGLHHRPHLEARGEVEVGEVGLGGRVGHGGDEEGEQLAGEVARRLRPALLEDDPHDVVVAPRAGLAEEGLRARVEAARGEVRLARVRIHTADDDVALAPPGEGAGGHRHVRGGAVGVGVGVVAGAGAVVDAHREELQKLAGVVLVGRGRRARVAVEVAQHRRFLADGRDERAEVSEGTGAQEAVVRPDERRRVVVRRQDAVHGERLLRADHRGFDGEVVVPEERHLLAQRRGRHPLQDGLALGVEERPLVEDGGAGPRRFGER